MTAPLPKNFIGDDIKLVVTDVDGTLLGPDHKLSDRTAEVLNAMPEDVTFMLATGKTKWSTREIFEKVERLQNNPSIFLNGLFVANPDGTTRYETLLEKEVVAKMLDFSKEYNQFMMVFCGDKVVGSSHSWDDKLAALIELYHEPKCEKMDHDELRKLVSEGDLPVHKVMYLADEDAKSSICRGDLSLFMSSFDMGEKYVPFQAVPQLLEIVPGGTSKAVALDKVIKDLGIRSDQVIAFGDGENDMAMLQYAGCSVAVGNAKPFVKPLAKYVGKSNREDGLADVIERVFDIDVAGNNEPQPKEQL